MDYECDVGYFRKPGQLMCTFKESSLSDIAQKAVVLERQNVQCTEQGWYTVTSGYRKVPGNICNVGGSNLAPVAHSCDWTPLGWKLEIEQFGAIGVTALVCALIYYGWPLI